MTKKENATAETYWKIREMFQNKNLEPDSGIRGLMFSKKRNLIIENKYPKRTAIHMFFVFFKTDIYWLDENLNIVDYKKMKPFTIHRPKKSAKYIVEISK